MCRCMVIVLVRMSQSTVDGRKILRGRSAGVALPRRTFITVRGSHQVSVVIVQEAGDSQQVSHTHQVGSQVLHHRLLRTGGVEIQLSAEDRREDVELLVGNLVGG